MGEQHEHVFDVAEGDFETEVLARSRTTPVVVDFWAAWCGPCRTLGPLLEEAVSARDGKVLLAKVDVDAAPGLAARYRVRGIPAVMAFRDGEVVAQFTGAVPRVQVEAFLDGVVPSEADRLVAEARAAHEDDALALYEQALEVDPGHREAAVGLAELLVNREPERALELVKPHRPDRPAEAVATRAELARNVDRDEPTLRQRVSSAPGDGAARLALGRLLAARGDYADAVEQLLEAVRSGGDSREPAREQLVALFTVLGDGSDLVARARRELARALY